MKRGALPDHLTIERESELRRDVERVRDDGVETTQESSAIEQGVSVNTAVHDGVFKIFMGLFAAILAIFYLTFSHDAETVFMIGICAFYCLMYFGTPIVLRRASREKRENKDWTEFLDEPFSTNTGLISGRTALLQICTVPAALAICVIGICVVITLSR